MISLPYNTSRGNHEIKKRIEIIIKQTLYIPNSVKRYKYYRVYALKLIYIHFTGQKVLFSEIICLELADI